MKGVELQCRQLRLRPVWDPHWDSQWSLLNFPSEGQRTQSIYLWLIPLWLRVAFGNNKSLALPACLKWGWASGHDAAETLGQRCTLMQVHGMRCCQHTWNGRHRWTQRWANGITSQAFTCHPFYKLLTWALPMLTSTHIHTQLMCTDWSRRRPLKLPKPYGRETASHSHIPLNEPNYSGTNKESWHTVSQAFTHRIYICSESIWTPDSTQVYSSFQLPTLNITPRKKYELAIQYQKVTTFLTFTCDRWQKRILP